MALQQPFYLHIQHVNNYPKTLTESETAHFKPISYRTVQRQPVGWNIIEIDLETPPQQMQSIQLMMLPIEGGH